MASRSNILYGGASLLPRTGQTLIYQDFDDGHLEAGRPGSDRFIAITDKLVYDAHTQLVWPKDMLDLPSPIVSGGTLQQFTWDNAFSAIVALNNAGYGGYTDWRLPNAFELVSLYNFGASSSPAVNAIFDNYPTDYCWSATTASNSDANAITTRLSTSHTTTYRTKTNTYYIIPVRGGVLNYGGTVPE